MKAINPRMGMMGTLLLALAILAIAPATVGAQNNNNNNDPGECVNSSDEEVDCPSGPTEEELASAAARELLDEALREAAGVDPSDLAAVAEAAGKVAAAREGVETTAAALEASREAGDPVLVTTGQYAHEETDLIIPGSSFSVGRKHVSEGGVEGSLGRGWATGLDSRITRGNWRG
jgi:hypothetical protein